MYQRITATLLGSALAMTAHAAPADIAGDAISRQKIIEIKGVELPALLGKAFDTFTVFAVRQGMLMPIAHQSEDFDDEGYTWFPEGKTPLRGKQGILDSHDSLLFRFADAGEQMTPAQAALAPALTEIRITERGQTRHVYVSEQGMRFVHQPLANYDPVTGVISTDYFTLKTSPDNLLEWSDFRYHNVDDATLLDTLKIRLEAGVVLDNARVRLDNGNLQTRVVATHAGPVRTVILAESTMNFAGVPVTSIDLQMQLYPQQINFDARIRIPALLKKLLRDPSATISIDGHNLAGSELRSSSAPQVAQVDGSMSKDEKAMGETALSQHGWVWLTSRKGFDIFTSLYIPPNFSVPVNLYYDDNSRRTEEPERFAGQGPNVGYHLKDIPVNDTFHFALQAWFTDALAGIPPAQLGRALAHVPEIASSTPAAVTADHSVSSSDDAL